MEDKKGKRSISGYSRFRDSIKSRITNEEYQTLKSYALSKNISLEYYKDFAGNISDIIDVIDRICIVAKDFPLILEGKKHIVLSLFYEESKDFAYTEANHIFLNGLFYADTKNMAKDYEELEKKGRFVKGTTWKDIIYHELGHIVSNYYKINPLELAMEMLDMSPVYVAEYVATNLSQYSAAVYDSIESHRTVFDGSEIIAESFCGFYSGSNNAFSKRFVDECKKTIQRKEGKSMKRRTMSMSDESIYWLTNKEWYRINKEKDCFEILDSAPIKAKLSFEVWSGKRKPSKKSLF